MSINPNDSLLFNGIYSTSAYTGYITLLIDSGLYECTTVMFNGRSAGKLKVNERTLEFMDTLFYPIPAVYGPTFALSGPYEYVYDGNKLELQRNLNGSRIRYEFFLMNPN
jgi:hypothetical protein